MAISDLNDQELVKYLQEQEDQKRRERYEKYLKKQMIAEKEHKFWSTQVIRCELIRVISDDIYWCHRSRCRT
jgi:predicted nucleic acid-binding protein